MKARTTTQIPQAPRVAGWEGGNVVTTSETACSPGFTPSKHQNDFFSWIRKGTGNAVLEAVAGAGKTTTLLEATKLIPAHVSSYAVVFNKKNADEMRAKFPSHVQCGTFHAFWMRAIRKNIGNQVKVESRKTDMLIERVLPTQAVRDFRSGGTRLVVTPEYRDYISPIRQLVGFAKNSGVGLLLPDRASTYSQFVDHYDMRLDEDAINEAKAIEYAQRVLALSQSTTDMIDFDDMLYLPLINGWGIERRDFVLVDEAQDTNAVQVALVKRMAKEKTGRIVFVGDPHQSCYGFRGAMNDAMDTIRKQFHATKLPLTVSFRCPQNVVKHAQQYVSHIQAHATAPMGSVVTIADTIPRSMLTPDTAIVCRTTAPLVTLALSLIGKRIGCKILGRDIGQKLCEVVKRQKADTLETLSVRLEAYRARELARAEAKDDAALAQQANDQIDSLVAIIQSMAPTDTVDALIAEIGTLFANDAQTGILTLCTVHKAKGLEWPRVIIIRPDLMPLPWVRKGWQLQQEKNLAYIATTRAKETLVIVQGEHIAVEEVH